MTTPRYTAKFYGHIESIDYRDGHGQLWLQCGFSTSWFLDCRDTARLPLTRRKQILEDLCDYLSTKNEPAVFVIDETDKHRRELEQTIRELTASGHRLTVKHTSSEQCKQAEDTQWLRWIKAGKKLKIGETEIATEEDYLRWRNAQQEGSSQ